MGRPAPASPPCGVRGEGNETKRLVFNATVVINRADHVVAKQQKICRMFPSGSPTWDRQEDHGALNRDASKQLDSWPSCDSTGNQNMHQVKTDAADKPGQGETEPGSDGTRSESGSSLHAAVLGREQTAFP